MSVTTRVEQGQQRGDKGSSQRTCMHVLVPPSAGCATTDRVLKSLGGTLVVNMFVVGISWDLQIWRDAQTHPQGCYRLEAATTHRDTLSTLETPVCGHGDTKSLPVTGMWPARRSSSPKVTKVYFSLKNEELVWATLCILDLPCLIFPTWIQFLLRADLELHQQKFLPDTRLKFWK